MQFIDLTITTRKSNLGGCWMLGLIKCRVCDEDIEVYDAEKVIIHYSTCATCREKSGYPEQSSTDLSFKSHWEDA
jgi:hypothetical protein